MYPLYILSVLHAAHIILAETKGFVYLNPTHCVYSFMMRSGHAHCVAAVEIDIINMYVRT